LSALRGTEPVMATAMTTGFMGGFSKARSVPAWSEAECGSRRARVTPMVYRRCPIS
jgi:hypothetical protein